MMAKSCMQWQHLQLHGVEAAAVAAMHAKASSITAVACIGKWCALVAALSPPAVPPLAAAGAEALAAASGPGSGNWGSGGGIGAGYAGGYQ